MYSKHQFPRKKNHLLPVSNAYFSWLMLLDRACNLNTFVLFACLLSPKLSFCQWCTITAAVSKSYGMWMAFNQPNLCTFIYRAASMGTPCLWNGCTGIPAPSNVQSIDVLLFTRDKINDKVPFFAWISVHIFRYSFLYRTLSHFRSLNIVAIDRLNESICPNQHNAT